MVKLRSSSDVYRLLANAGIPESYARSLLPSWWDEADLGNPASLAEMKLSLARNFGVDLLGLSTDAPQVTFDIPRLRRLKRSVRYSEGALLPAVAVAIAAARAVHAASPRPHSALPATPLAARRFVLEDLGGKYVSLRGLIQLSWASGIPILHVGSFPPGMPKMDGLVVTIEGQPTIVLSKLVGFSAWMAFILAHELGHIALGHSDANSLLIDESLGEASLTARETDPQERAADDYALLLLGGNSISGDPLQGLGTAQLQANRAMELQRSHKVDAGHLLLRHAYQADDWQRALTALQSLDQEKRAISDIHEAMSREIDLRRIAKSGVEFLKQVTTARSPVG